MRLRKSREPRRCRLPLVASLKAKPEYNTPVAGKFLNACPVCRQAWAWRCNQLVARLGDRINWRCRDSRHLSCRLGVARARVPPPDFVFPATPELRAQCQPEAKELRGARPTVPLTIVPRKPAASRERG